MKAHRQVKGGTPLRSFDHHFTWNATTEQFNDSRRSEVQLTPEMRLAEGILEQAIDDFKSLIDTGHVPHEHIYAPTFSDQDRKDLDLWLFDDTYGRDDHGQDVENFISFSTVCAALAVDPAALRAALITTIGTREELRAVPLLTDAQISARATLKRGRDPKAIAA